MIQQAARETMECPNCKLICPPGTARCDCGHDFSSSEMSASYLSKEEQISREIERATHLTPLNTFFSLSRLKYSLDKILYDKILRVFGLDKFQNR
jgi:hypothetical protein